MWYLVLFLRLSKEMIGQDMSINGILVLIKRHLEVCCGAGLDLLVLGGEVGGGGQDGGGPQVVTNYRLHVHHNLWAEGELKERVSGGLLLICLPFITFNWCPEHVMKNKKGISFLFSQDYKQTVKSSTLSFFR